MNKIPIYALISLNFRSIILFALELVLFMNNTAELGKIKKRFIFRPILSRLKKSFSKSKIKFTKRTLAILFVFLFILAFGGKEIFSQIDSTLKNYNVLADSNVTSPTLTLASNLELTNNLETSTINVRDKINSNTLTMDKRSYLLDQYFLSNNSPLYGTGKLFVAACNKYGAPRDCITVAAIARNETDLCKYNNSADMHNCWGFGGAGTNRMRFDSFEQSIDRVTRALAYDYGSQYMIDPSLMEGRFCGSDSSCVGWGNKIKLFMRQIDDFGKNQGLGSILDMR